VQEASGWQFAKSLRLSSSTTSVTVKGSPARTLGANLKNYDVGIELTTPAETFLEYDENIPSCVRVLARPLSLQQSGPLLVERDSYVR